MFDSGASQSYAALARCKSPNPQNQYRGRLRIAQARFGEMTLNCADFGNGGYDGHRNDGLLGYDFISRFVVGIDYAARTLTLHDPSAFRYGGIGHRTRLTLLEDDSGGKVPLIDLVVEDESGKAHTGKFIVDTGVRTVLTLGDRFATQAGLKAGPGASIRALAGGGPLVRQARLAIRRVPAIRFGGERIVDPVITVSDDKEGILAAPEFDGIIGGELLKRYRVFLDYPHQQMIVEHTVAANRPYDYDMSGLFLAADRPGFRTFTVRDVVTESPAAEAGVKVGDVIIAVAGVQTRRLTLASLRDLLKRAGSTIVLVIERGGTRTMYKLVLRRLI